MPTPAPDEALAKPPAVAAPAEPKPYKGVDSYQVEDAELFFGRKHDADELVAKILSSRVTLLHAQSGAGKTSLLNAKVIPELERRGWTAVRILPLNDPIASVRSAVLHYVVPPPALEVVALDRVVSELDGLGPAPTLDGLLARYDNEPLASPVKRRVVEPIEPSAGQPGPAGLAAKVTPYVCRLLRATLDLDGFAAHVAAVAQGGRSQPLETVRVTGATPVGALRELLASKGLAEAHSTLLGYLDPPSDRLWDFLANLVEVYGARRDRFGLVLLFDQFEELFTRFIDPGKAAEVTAVDRPDWRLRYRFFDEIETAFRAQSDSADHDRPASDPGRPQSPPIRYVFSMRSEYTAQLGPVRRFTPEIDQSVYHLQILTKDQALDAIQEPAAKFGFTYEKQCYQRIIDDLLKEERFVEPAHLSLVCEKLWDAKGREIRIKDPGAASRERDTLPPIKLASYETDLEGARGILRAFLRDFLKELSTVDERAEALELMEPLITGSGTRNIVERTVLIKAPFRKVQLRDDLLGKLVNRTILRVERRVGGDFVEITHEFLIPSVRELIQEVIYADATQYRFRTALRTLQAADEAYLGIESSLAVWETDYESLNENRARVEWSWNPRAVELMLRASVYYGAARDSITFWADAFAGTADTLDAVPALRDIAHGVLRRTMLGPEELREINQRRDALTLSPSEVAVVFRSQMLNFVTSRPEDIRYWAGKMFP